MQKLEVNRAKVQNQTENAGKLRICHPPARPGVATLAKSVRLHFETRIENLSDFSAGG